ncbi:nitrous oxide-stimulated promoter family protein [Wenzhouxiangella limi]|uniref:Nitrous oxide-stimulated promoter family protein n=1 Tax=Wenzhouxiangella limi TaxID=2707351 RepID=A0A845V8G7_9GAMM|nr:nitrous oxide-stimulated promoter family protein [Wenzhouxiangella limi]NDY96225.1 nitrous oxide-stimulated promoter family protein [Wenzhouxiangella limi]
MNQQSIPLPPETTPLKGRLRREFRTMEAMVRIWCRAKHPGQAPSGAVCPECQAFLDYACKRLEKCPYGEDKPTCAKCPVHCYKRAQREHAREVMRFAGPRMVWRHPWLSLMHLLDKRHRVEHPMEQRRRHSRSR